MNDNLSDKARARLMVRGAMLAFVVGFSAYGGWACARWLIG